MGKTVKRFTSIIVCFRGRLAYHTRRPDGSYFLMAMVTLSISKNAFPSRGFRLKMSEEAGT